MTDLDLDAITARADAATEGPWKAVIANICGDDSVYVETADGRSVADLRDDQAAVATFIAHARADVPALVAEVRRLQAIVDAWGGPLVADREAAWAEVSNLKAAIEVLTADRDALAAKNERLRGEAVERQAVIMKLAGERDALAAELARARTAAEFTEASCDREIRRLLGLLDEAGLLEDDWGTDEEIVRAMDAPTTAENGANQ